VMIGREIYSSPYLLAEADQQIYGVEKEVISRQQVINLMADYVDAYVSSTLEQGNAYRNPRAWHILRHMLGLCNGLAGARQFRRYLSESARADGAGGHTLKEAFAKVTMLNEQV
jgi:tRNA-dihydrouridine synthase A